MIGRPQRRRGRYLVQRRVPRDLRHRYKYKFVERYLGTSDAAEARRRASRVWTEIGDEFAAMRRSDDMSAELGEHVRRLVQWRTHRRLLDDPLGGEAAVAAQIDAADVADDARAVLAELGHDATPENVYIAERAVYLGLIGGRQLHNRGHAPPDPGSPRGPVAAAALPAASGEGPITVTEAAERYCRSSKVTVGDKSKRQMRASARLLADHVGHRTPASAVTSRAASEFRDRLKGIAAEYRRDPACRGMTLAEIAERHPARSAADAMSRASVNKHLSFCRTLFSWLRDEGYLPEDHRNPFDRKQIPKHKNADSTGYLPMTDSEVKALVAGAGELPREPAKNFVQGVGWLVMVAAYTGLRAGELCALTADDVRSRNGVPFLAVRRGKTASARRVVPLHEDLIRAGFADYARRCEGRLFGCDAATVAKRFPAFRRGLGVDRERVGFHSLRKSFATKLEHADVSSDTAAVLLGHRGLRSFTFDVYSPDGPTLRQLADAVAKVSYEGLRPS